MTFVIIIKVTMLLLMLMLIKKKKILWWWFDDNDYDASVGDYDDHDNDGGSDDDDGNDGRRKWNNKYRNITILCRDVVNDDPFRLKILHTCSLFQNALTHTAFKMQTSLQQVINSQKTIGLSAFCALKILP